MRNSLLGLLTSLDAFGQPIELNFRGKSSFQTSCGGLISLLVNIFVGWLTLLTLMQLISQEEMTI